MTERTERRGVESIEFALVVPIALMILAGIFDYGWYFHQEMVFTDANRHAARAASVTPQGGDFQTAAIDAFLAALEAGGQSSIEPEIEVSEIDMSNGEKAIRVKGVAEYSGLWGLVALPYELHSTVVFRREDQPDET